MTKKFPDLTGDGKVTQADILKGRGVFQVGGSIDDQMKMAMNQPMMPDEEMEDNYLNFIIDEALDEQEEEMLMSKLEQDEQLSMLFDKVLEVASEFAGAQADERQGMQVGGMMEIEEEKVDQFGRPIDSDIARDELKKNMMSVNPRYQ